MSHYPLACVVYSSDFDVVRGLTVRVGQSRKNLMLLIRNGGTRIRVKLGTYLECGLSGARELACDKLDTARPAKDAPPSITVGDAALDAFFRIHGQNQWQSTWLRCQYLLDKSVRHRLVGTAPEGQDEVTDERHAR